MPRPIRSRTINAYPDYWSFSPEEGDAGATVEMTLDEFEAVRLIDHLKMTQEECAARMGVSRATVAGIHERARHKMADALVTGKRLRIAGGTYTLAPSPPAGIGKKGGSVYRIAVPDEGGGIGQRFGMTSRFRIYDTMDGRVLSCSILDAGCTRHGALSLLLHAAEADTVICGRIGLHARAALKEAGIRFFPGVSGDPDRAVEAYLLGALSFDPKAVCPPRENDRDRPSPHPQGAEE